MKRFIFITTILITFTFSCFGQSSVSSVISNLKATINNISEDSATIKLTWKIPTKNDITEFIVYRDTKQIAKENLSLLKPLEVLTGKYTAYFDTVTELSSEYYYAVLTVTRNGEFFDIIIPTVNSTVNPIIPKPKKTVLSENINKKGKIETRENERELIPLPFLNESEQLNEKKIKIPKENIEVAKKLSAKETQRKSKPLQILPQDKTPKSGDQYLLSSIVNSSFTKAQWDEAEKELLNFLKINRTEQTVSRANFYLGQIYYYQGKSTNALNAFMTSLNYYPIESRQWIDEVLEQFEIETDPKE
jgi:tetratricopeptide (TPR) repeat protein